MRMTKKNKEITHYRFTCPIQDVHVLKMQSTEQIMKQNQQCQNLHEKKTLKDMSTVTHKCQRKTMS